MNLLLRILFDEQGGTLSITRKTANTLATAAAMNLNFSEIEAVINGGIDVDNIEDDAVDKSKIAADVVRSDYGLIQHTDGALYVDVSDTNPGLEISDGGLRVKVDDSSIERAADGIQTKALGITNAMLAGLISNDKMVETYLTNALHDLVARHPLTVGGTGAITAAGAYDNIAKLGTFAARTKATNYLAATDGFIVAYGSGAEGYYISAYTDSAAAPSTLISRSGSTSGTTAGWWTVFTPVKKGEYYRVDCTGTLSGYYWIPMGN